MKHVRKRLTYANVMSSIAVFLILGGATALAAGLAKNSVGPKQLKKNAVTALKIKNGAVTGPKIGPGAVGAGALAGGSVGAGALANGAVGSDKLGANSVTNEKIANDAVNGAKIAGNAVGSGNIAPDAVTGDKIAPGSVSAADINPAGLPFSQVIARLRGTTPQALTTTPTFYPLANPTFVQPAGMNANWLSAVDVVFPAGCTQPRSAVTYMSVDSPTPATLNVSYLSGIGQVADNGTGTVARRMEITPFSGGGPTSLFEPNADTAHTFSLLVFGTCTAGAGINATAAGIDVIGTR